MLTAREVAVLVGAGESSVRLWAKEGRFPGARLEESPVGTYWLIPESALNGFEVRKPGRPQKQPHPPSKRGRARKGAK